ncbi:MAG: hypothetical protein V2I76_01240 [Roseobacter sp.]|jgi:hypothetical protein|nr:hypothetical protein [Roseobacter sp.]
MTLKYALPVLLLVGACNETTSVPPSAASSTAQVPAAATSSESVDPDAVLMNVFGRPLVWCASSRFVEQVSRTKTRAEIEAGRMTLEEVRAVSPGCGKTTDYFLLSLDENKQPVVVGATQTADGAMIPLYKGVGGRVLF